MAIRRQQGQTVRNRLANQHPVEGVAVMLRQAPKLQDGGFSQIERRNIVFGPFIGNVLMRRFGER